MQEIWRFTLFGKLQCQRGAKAITRYQTRQGNIFLGYLALHQDRNHTREELATMIWPEDHPAESIPKLRRMFYMIRKSFEPAGVPRGSVFLCEHSTIQLNPASTVFDTQEFEELISSAKELSYSPKRAELLRQAVELAKEPLLSGLEESWVLKERRRFKELQSDAQSELVETWEALGEFDKAIAAATDQVKQDLLNEQNHYRLIRLYGYANQADLADRQYKKLCNILDKELGMAPTADTQELIKKISAGTLEQKHPGRVEGVPLVSSGIESTQTKWVSVHPTKLYGRDKELRSIAELLRSRQRRVVTLTGLPGIGKSRLATEVVDLLSSDSDYRMVYVDASDIETLETLVDEIEARLQDVKTSDERCLLFLNGLRGFGEESALYLRKLLNQGDQLDILITSLQRIGIEGEQEVPLGPIAVPHITDSVEEVLSNPSIQLFTERARSICADFKVTVRNVRALTVLCQELEGYPLQLLLAASNRGNFGTEQMQVGISDRVSFLQTKRKDILKRHQSWFEAINEGFQQLSPEARDMFVRLLDLPNEWTLETARSELGKSFDCKAFSELEECAWVNAMPGIRGSYSILPSLLEFCAEATNAQRKKSS